MTPGSYTVQCPVRGYRREVPNWERRDMTVCIAAVCEENTADPKIVACTDRKVGGMLGSSDTMLKTKLLRMPRGEQTTPWYALVSGTDTDIIACVRHLRTEFNGANMIDDTNVIALTRKALQKRKREKAEGLIQGSYAISYDDFLATGKARFPDDDFRRKLVEVEMLRIEAEFIILGYDGNLFPLLVKTTDTGGASIKEDFVTSGEGWLLAEASMLNREHHNLSSFGDALYRVYEAKRFAQGVSSVGPGTTMTVFHRDGSLEMAGGKGLSYLEENFNKLGRTPIANIKPHASFFEKITPLVVEVSAAQSS